MPDNDDIVIENQLFPNLISWTKYLFYKKHIIFLYAMSIVK